MGVKGVQNSGRASETESIIEAVFVKHNLPQRGSIAYSFKKLALEEKDRKIRKRTEQDQSQFSLTWTCKCTAGESSLGTNRRRLLKSLHF